MVAGKHVANNFEQHALERDCGEQISFKTLFKPYMFGYKLVYGEFPTLDHIAKMFVMTKVQVQWRLRQAFMSGFRGMQVQLAKQEEKENK